MNKQRCIQCFKSSLGVVNKRQISIINDFPIDNR
nr:MAG TPA: hypothetical protein [Caudoviricetes sp.]DAG47129.1 MAG TPA: hypothetical protein [Caudoviricetes sp.]DAK54185.1 MAG TPA: hypothetical protein [Caudoviricetes sp.]DAW08269.1 MAG TPA: hypothetical protein [Caudoviricetes sp.]